MPSVGLPGADEVADLLKSLWREQSLIAKLCDRKAIRFRFILCSKSVRAFVLINPKLYGRRHFGKHCWIDDQKAFVRSGGIVVQQRILNGGKPRACKRLAVEPKLSVRNDGRATLVIRDIHLRRRVWSQDLRAGKRCLANADGNQSGQISNRFRSHSDPIAAIDQQVSQSSFVLAQAGD